MTREEAISVFERVAHTESKWPGTENTLEALDMAISALRQQEHFRDLTKKVEPMTLDDAIAHLDDTLSDTGRKWSCESCRMEHMQLRAWLAELRDIKQERNAPLTLDELRKMDGEPVWVVWPDLRIHSQWFIVGSVFWIEMFVEDDGTLLSGYGNMWIAYRQKPEEVPR